MIYKRTIQIILSKIMSM